MHDPAQETWDAVSEACDALHCNEGYVTHMRDPGPAFAFQFYDYDLEQKWAADGGDPEDPPSTARRASAFAQGDERARCGVHPPRGSGGLGRLRRL
jgi:hypothetical protein